MKDFSVDIEETNIGAHVILVDLEGKIILQKRDDNPKISFPGMISMFGGTINISETPMEGLKRELQEELDFMPVDSNIKKLNIYIKTKAVDGADYTINVFIIRGVEIEKLKLKEGAGFAHDFPEEIITNPKLTRICKLAVQDFIDKTAVLN